LTDTLSASASARLIALYSPYPMDSVPTVKLCGKVAAMRIQEFGAKLKPSRSSRFFCPAQDFERSGEQSCFSPEDIDETLDAR
jgi:hypothetical protein